ncbi:hypothetical protein AMECASPLE_014461 [Ameca splendens]|uniref:Transmembrane protein n=1 Tax=Ameca splendens TaxID=208324 RepID=A0ABV0XEQ2_9TELE
MRASRELRRKASELAERRKWKHKYARDMKMLCLTLALLIFPSILTSFPVSAEEKCAFRVMCCLFPSSFCIWARKLNFILFLFIFAYLCCHYLCSTGAARPCLGRFAGVPSPFYYQMMD